MQTDGLGLPVWKPTAEQQAEIDALPRQYSGTSDPIIHDQVQKRQEKNSSMVKGYRWQNQDQLTKVRQGRILSQGEFLYLLQKINSSFFYNTWTTGDGLVGLNVIEHDAPRYICACQLGAACEYETIRVDEHGLPGRSKYRGWRTVLLRLIGAGIITEDQANEVFGKAYGPESGPYLEQLYQFRNRSRA